MNRGWRYYNNAMIPNCAPHEQVSMKEIENGSIWRIGRGEGTPFLARWTSNFDCEYKTEFWYCIKDDIFDINLLKAKRRYEVNKGCKFFLVQHIDAIRYAEDIVSVTIEAAKAYPDKYRQEVNKEKLLKNISSWNESYIVYGAFDRDNNRLCGYAYILKHEAWIEFLVLKTCPDSEKLGVNAAIVATICQDFSDELKSGIYICDGARPIFHETHFQDYLEKYFGFRKAYCQLHIKYAFGVGLIVRLLYPFMKLLKKNDKNKYIHRILGILLMEEIVRSNKNNFDKL